MITVYKTHWVIFKMQFYFKGEIVTLNYTDYIAMLSICHDVEIFHNKIVPFGNFTLVLFLSFEYSRYYLIF